MESDKPKKAELRSDLAYSAMIRDILSAIRSGELEDGDRIPSEPELVRKYKISLNSIRRGLAAIESKGIISRRRGSGTYVQAVHKLDASGPRNTILLIKGVDRVSPHPYYDPRDRALFSRLTELGWRISPFGGAAIGGTRELPDWLTVNYAVLAEELARRSDIAGIVLDLPDPASVMEHVRPFYPSIAFHNNPLIPFVTYDLLDEWAHAIGIVFRAGSKNMLIVSRGDVLPAIARARAVLKAGDTLRPICRMLQWSPSLTSCSAMISKAYEATLDVLNMSREVDGVLVTDDFLAQGVLDALRASCGRGKTGIPIVCVINRESRIHTSVPYTAVILDGHAVGIAAADLLHQHITAPRHATPFIRLRGQVNGAPGISRSAVFAFDSE